VVQCQSALHPTANAPSPSHRFAAGPSLSREERERVSSGQSGEGRKQFFFEKKAAPARREPKNFCLLGARLRPERGSKSFLPLFFKKEDLSIACLPSPDCPEGFLWLAGNFPKNVK
jgi:hypothetical protein